VKLREHHADLAELGNERLVVMEVALHRGTRACTGAVAVVQRRPFHPIESTDMSADKDRGIRRLKQKRAKALKKLARRSRGAGTAPGTTRTPPAPQAQ
jgi:hypothetical protein